ncbi:dihydroneopterin aldolase [Candidatus Poribacteria bacterium]|nr:MAG: dihydroneopterin aldolase [Candidatus Poribacteria bacterium]
MDKIILKGIGFHGYHGVVEAERHIGQKYEIDLELTTDLSAAGTSDDLTHTIDYAQVVQLAIKIGTQQSFRLFEALAEAIAAAILDQFQIEEVRIAVKKLSPPIEPTLSYAGVEIHRKRKSDG